MVQILNGFDKMTAIPSVFECFKKMAATLSGFKVFFFSDFKWYLSPTLLKPDHFNNYLKNIHIPNY